jgi:hypothetical protein
MAGEAGAPASTSRALVTALTAQERVELQVGKHQALGQSLITQF